jgi:hypothetical protein
VRVIQLEDCVFKLPSNVIAVRTASLESLGPNVPRFMDIGPPLRKFSGARFIVFFEFRLRGQRNTTRGLIAGTRHEKWSRKIFETVTEAVYLPAGDAHVWVDIREVLAADAKDYPAAFPRPGKGRAIDIDGTGAFVSAGVPVPDPVIRVTRHNAGAGYSTEVRNNWGGNWAGWAGGGGAVSLGNNLAVEAIREWRPQHTSVNMAVDVDMVAVGVAASRTSNDVETIGRSGDITSQQAETP